MPSIIIVDDALLRHPVRPEHIDTSKHFWNAFDHNETEVSARYIVRLMQSKGAWEPFRMDAIDAFYTRVSKHIGFTFNKLRPDLIYQNEDGTFFVTHEFITRCFQSSPQLEAKK